MTTFAASVTIVDLPVVTGAELLESRIGRASSKSGDVRYAAESRQVTASQRNDAMGQELTFEPQIGRQPGDDWASQSQSWLLRARSGRGGQAMKGQYLAVP